VVKEGCRQALDEAATRRQPHLADGEVDSRDSVGAEHED
jgi:hypothetical protein